VVVWLDGGPSHLETLDPKPDAPVEVRGPFDSIQTSVPGVTLTECMPGMAARLDRWSIIRSMTSPLGEHNFGTHYLLSGYRPTPVLEYPSFSSAAVAAQGSAGALPPHVAIPDYRVGGAGFTGHGFLSGSAVPFPTGGDPARPDFTVKNLLPYPGLDSVRLQRRRDFVRQLDQFTRARDAGRVAVPGQADASVPVAARPVAAPTEGGPLEQAWDLAGSAAVRGAFERGMRAEQIYLSLERNMQCAVGFCGHCQLGPAFICKDGPVFRYDRMAPYLDTGDL